MSGFSHVDDGGRAQMVDVSGKDVQRRRARARGEIFVSDPTLKLIRENSIKKGDVLTVAQIAGIGAAKKCGELIPLCHPLVLDSIDVKMLPGDKSVVAESEVICTGKTGVEMEALTAVSVALLAVYDMCKAVDKNMVIGEIKLIEKVKENV